VSPRRCRAGAKTPRRRPAERRKTRPAPRTRVTLSAGPTKTLTVPKEFARMVRVVPAVVEERVVVALERMR
jgi:hypothetical protein